MRYAIHASVETHEEFTQLVKLFNLPTLKYGTGECEGYTEVDTHSEAEQFLLDRLSIYQGSNGIDSPTLDEHLNTIKDGYLVLDGIGCYITRILI
jgi:hypothetical protein